MTDEMDLIGELKGAEPLRPEAYQRARAVLRAAMAEPGTVRVLDATSAKGTIMETPVQDRGSRTARRRGKVGVAGKLGIGTGIGVAAAAAAIAFVVTSSSTGGAVPVTVKPPAAAGGHAASSPLVALAASVKADVPSAGDAWLVISTQVNGTKTMQVLYTLYTDSGGIYSGYSVSDIKRAIARHQDQMYSGGYAPVLKAVSGVAGDTPARARVNFFEATEEPLFGLSPAAQKKVWDKQQAARQAFAKQKGATVTPKPYSPAAAQLQMDGDLWSASIEALSDGGGNPLVRQGALRLLSTVPSVKVTHSVTNGRPTLTLSAGPELWGGDASEVATLDAKTGMLVKDVSPVKGLPLAYTTYQSSRVTTAKL